MFRNINFSPSDGSYIAEKAMKHEEYSDKGLRLEKLYRWAVLIRSYEIAYGTGGKTSKRPNLAHASSLSQQSFILLIIKTFIVKMITTV